MEEGWLRLEKIKTDFTNDKLETFRLDFSRSAIREASLRIN